MKSEFAISLLDDLPIKPPFKRHTLEGQISAHSEAVQALFALLPSIEGLSLAEAVEAESLAYGALQGSADHRNWLENRRQAPVRPPGRLDITRDSGLISLTINRPHAQNAVDRNMRDALYDAFELAALDPDISTVRLTGAGKAFCTGADLTEFGTTRDPKVAHAIRMQTLPALVMIRCQHKFEAHVQGACVGSGLEMAAFAHKLTADRRAWFQLPELAMGLIPGAGGCVSITRRIGWERTALLVLSGKRINAQMALDWGLIDAIIGD